MSDHPSARARCRPRSTSSPHIQPWRPHSARWPTCRAPAGPSSSRASATKRFCCSGSRDCDSSSRRHPFATASSASRSTHGSDGPAAVRALEHEPRPLARGVGGGDVQEVDVVAARLAQRVRQPARAEDVELQDVVQGLLEGDGRGAVDHDVGAGEQLRIQSAEPLGGQIGGQGAQAAGGERLVGESSGERLARQDLVDHALLGGVVVGRAEQQRDGAGALDLAQPRCEDGLAQEAGGAREQQLRIGEPCGDAVGHGCARWGGSARLRSGRDPIRFRARKDAAGPFAHPPVRVIDRASLSEPDRSGARPTTARS